MPVGNDVRALYDELLLDDDAAELLRAGGGVEVAEEYTLDMLFCDDSGVLNDELLGELLLDDDAAKLVGGCRRGSGGGPGESSRCASDESRRLRLYSLASSFSSYIYSLGLFVFLKNSAGILSASPERPGAALVFPAFSGSICMLFAFPRRLARFCLLPELDKLVLDELLLELDELLPKFNDRSPFPVLCSVALSVFALFTTSIVGIVVFFFLPFSFIMLPLAKPTSVKRVIPYNKLLFIYIPQK
ncbi:hypothetical protein FACS189472_00340 [Alphaproteobacteria bacterium]|nr:hypothetical protein FACS189472_00340 [Alphaproteobacteria bacterium]